MLSTDQEPFRKRLKRRAVHALILLGHLVYLQMCIRVLEGLRCIDANGTQVLAIQLNIPCYTGTLYTVTLYTVPLLILFFRVR